MGKEQDQQTLKDFYNDDYEVTPKEARTALGNAYRLNQSLPPDVFSALQNISILDMGNKTSLKKRDRQRGQQIRKKRTGSRRG